MDPMHQFHIEPLVGSNWTLFGHSIAFTNSALYMVLTLVLLWIFMLGGMKRDLVPGRWQAAVEGATGFVMDMLRTNIGPQGKRFAPYMFSLFMFLVICNLLSLIPSGIVPGAEPFASTSHFTITGLLAVISFSIVLIVGFSKHGFHFFSLFVPHGTPKVMLPLIFFVELLSFCVRPFSLGLRLFVAMTAGHVLLEVFANFIVQSSGAGAMIGLPVGIASMALMIGISALELLVAGIQAYVFALLTSLYINDAVNLH